MFRPTLALIHFLPIRDFHPLRLCFPTYSSSLCITDSALPVSLATTSRVSFDFLSYSYLDVSVHCVSPPLTLQLTANPIRIGFPHSDTLGSTLIINSPKLFADFHVLLRLFVPRHPPIALPSLSYSCPVIINPLTIT